MYLCDGKWQFDSLFWTAPSPHTLAEMIATPGKRENARTHHRPLYESQLVADGDEQRSEKGLASGFSAAASFITARWKSGELHRRGEKESQAR
jgi:hypothetical protein